jgi:hypothetical protein
MVETIADIINKSFEDKTPGIDVVKSVSNDVKSATLDMAVSIAKSDTAKIVNTDKPGAGISPFAKTITGDNELVAKYNQYLAWMTPVEKQSFYLKAKDKPLFDKVKMLEDNYKKSKLNAAKDTILSIELSRQMIKNSHELTAIDTDKEMSDTDKIQELAKIKKNREILEIKSSMLNDPTGAGNLSGSFLGYIANKQVAADVATGFGVGALTGSLVPGVGTTTGAVGGVKLGLQAGSTISAYKEGYGTMLSDMLDEGADLPNARKAAKVGAVFYAASELTQFNKLPGGRIVAKKIAPMIIKTAIKQYGIDLVENVSQESIQRLITDASTDYAVLRSKGLSETEVMSEMGKNVGKYAKNMGEEAKGSALAFAIVGAPGKIRATHQAISTARADYKALNNVGLTGQLADEYRQVSDVLANNGIESKDIVQIKDKVRTATGQDASGVVEGGIISLAKSVQDTTGAHEAFHYLANNFGNSEQYQKALEEVKKNENVNDAQANEILAEKFAEYRKTKAPTAPIADQLFASISEGVRKVFGKEKATQKLFDAFNNGEMADEVRAKQQKSILDNHREAFNTKVKNEHFAIMDELKQSTPVMERNDMESQAEYDPLTGALHINEKTTLNKSQKDAIMQQVEISKMKIPDNKIIEVSDGNETIKLKAREVSAQLSRKLNNLLKLKDCLGR